MKQFNLKQTLYDYQPANIMNNKESKEDEEIASLIGFLDSYSNSRRVPHKKFPTVNNHKKQKISSVEDIYEFHSFRESTLPNNNMNINILPPIEDKIDENNKKLFDFIDHEVSDNENKINFNIDNDIDENDISKDENMNVNFTFITPNIPKNSLRFDNKFKENFHSILAKDFDIFEYLIEVGEPNIIYSIVNFAFKNGDNLIKYDLSEGNISLFINFNKLLPFCTYIREKYHKNPYHNHIHGVDVFHSLFQLLYYSNISSILYLNSIDILSILIAGLVHDIGHPGFNNSYMVNSRSELACIYNDIHVLENYHCSEGYKIFLNSTTNILTNIEDSQFKIFRKRFIQIILSTDPSLHSKIISLIKNKLLINDISNGLNSNKLINIDNRKFEDQQESLNFLISFADTSHSCRPFQVTFKWTSLLMEEFWHQGDVEKELNIPISFLCDRKDSYVGKGQLGFIQAIILPGLNILLNISPSLEYLNISLDLNIEKWKDFLELKNKKNN